MGKRSGFTIIELVVVLGLISFLFFLTLPNLSRFTSHIALNAYKKTLVSELRLKQTQARVEHTSKTFEYDKVVLPKNTQTNNKQIVFSSSGLPPPGGSGTIKLSSSSGGFGKIVVSSVGRIRFE